MGGAITVPTLKSLHILHIAPTASTVPTLRSRRMPRTTVPTLKPRRMPRTTVPTLRPRILAHPASTTSTADAHRIRTACTAFVASTLARIQIPVCAVSSLVILGREEIRFLDNIQAVTYL